MEFVGNQINLKTILATLTVAFLVGRINLFGGTFPAAPAMITVMVAVSTVYIYLVPAAAAAMLTYIGQGAEIYGDMMAMIFCGVFFLFFHRQRFTINQRTAVTAAAVIFFNCIFFAAEHMLYLFSLQTVIREAIAVVIYIRVFNTAAKVIFVGRHAGAVTEEKMSIALQILVVSVIGGLPAESLVFPLWIFAALVTACCSGLQQAVSLTAIAAVFAQCRRPSDPAIFLGLMAALMIGWYLASLIDGKYRKTVMAACVFAVMYVSAGSQLPGAAAAAAVFLALPSSVMMRFWCAAGERLMPEAVSGQELKLASIRRDLLRKRQAFSRLAKLYGENVDGRQIISYQFSGMARTVDGILRDLNGAETEEKLRELPQISVGSASYAFEAVSGDSCLSFSFGDGRQALVISDGMGKGSRASAESRLVVHTLAELMQAGFDVDVAIKTINSILMTGRRSDMFATLDLAVISRETGRAHIFKMGAASTFIRHGDKVTMLKRPAPPAGIVDGLKLEYIDVHLRRGDLLIMVSDGITDCDRNDPECFWLRERLAEIGSRDPDTVAELIVNKAAEKYGIRERDDLTVMVAAI